MSIVKAAFLLSLIAAVGCKKADKPADNTPPPAAPVTPPPAGSADMAAGSGSAAAAMAAGSGSAATTAAAAPVMHLYMDEHDLGKVKAADVADAHKKDLAVEAKYNVNFKAYWVDEKAGKVYCLAEAPNPEAITAAHKEAHGLLPNKIMPVVEASDPQPIVAAKGMHTYLDVHELGAGKVTPEAVADAHKKDLAVEGKYKVSFLDYFVDPDSGTVMCLAQAPSAAAAIKTHKEAHGLIPKSMDEVIQGAPN
jgi:hypothetical protein